MQGDTGGRRGAESISVGVGVLLTAAHFRGALMWKHDLEHDRTATALPTVFRHSPAAGAEPLGFTPFFLSYPTANPSANSNSSTLKIYLKFHHFPSPSPWLPPWSNHYDLLPGLLQELPVSHLESNLHPAPTADPWIQ